MTRSSMQNNNTSQRLSYCRMLKCKAVWIAQLASISYNMISILMVAKMPDYLFTIIGLSGKDVGAYSAIVSIISAAR